MCRYCNANSWDTIIVLTIRRSAQYSISIVIIELVWVWWVYNTTLAPQQFSDPQCPYLFYSASSPVLLTRGPSCGWKAYIRRGGARCPEGIAYKTAITIPVPCSLRHDASHLGFGGPEPCLSSQKRNAPPRQGLHLRGVGIDRIVINIL
jgi:hypothetical protein